MNKTEHNIFKGQCLNIAAQEKAKKNLSHDTVIEEMFDLAEQIMNKGYEKGFHRLKPPTEARQENEVEEETIADNFSQEDAATERQINFIKKLCADNNKPTPNNLAELTKTEASTIIEELKG